MAPLQSCILVYCSAEHEPDYLCTDRHSAQLVQQYRSVQQALNGLEHAYHTLEVGFKVWPRLQLEYNHGRALYYLGKMALSERKYGEAISLMQGAVSTLESIRFPECDHPSIDRARNQVKSATAEVKSVLNPLIKDNSTIYFAVWETRWNVPLLGLTSNLPARSSPISKSCRCLKAPLSPNYRNSSQLLLTRSNTS